LILRNVAEQRRRHAAIGNERRSNLMAAVGFARLEQRARNMREMMSRLGVEPSRPGFDDGGRMLGEAARGCWGCRRGEDCRVWLDARLGRLEAAPPFCPNAVRFQAMRR
jgi:hypothetical protein